MLIMSKSGTNPSVSKLELEPQCLRECPPPPAGGRFTRGCDVPGCQRLIISRILGGEQPIGDCLRDPGVDDSAPTGRLGRFLAFIIPPKW